MLKVTVRCLKKLRYRCEHDANKIFFVFETTKQIFSKRSNCKSSPYKRSHLGCIQKWKLLTHIQYQIYQQTFISDGNEYCLFFLKIGYKEKTDTVLLFAYTIFCYQETRKRENNPVLLCGFIDGKMTKNMRKGKSERYVGIAIGLQGERIVLSNKCKTNLKRKRMPEAISCRN